MSEQLAARAEIIYADPPFPPWAVRDLILRLVRVGDETSDPDAVTLPTQPLPALVPDGHYVSVVQEIIAALATAGVVRVEGEDDDLAVTLAPEVLVSWDRLRRWIRADAGALRERQQLEVDAAEWVAAGRTIEALKAVSRSLGSAVALLKAGQVLLTAPAREYVDACAALDTAEAARGTRTRTETRRLVRWLGVLLLLAVIALGVAVQKSREADEAAGKAEAATNAAERAREAALRSAAETERRAKELVAARQAALIAAASGWADDEPNTATGLLREVEDGSAKGVLYLQASLDAALVPATTARLDIDEWIEDADINEDGSLVVTGGRDRVLRAWSVANGNLRTVSVQEAAITCLAFTPDYTHVVTGAADETLRVWDVATGKETLRIMTGAPELKRLGMGPAGDLVAVQTSDGPRRFSLKSGGQPFKTPLPGGSRRGDVALGPDDLAVWSANNRLRTNDAEDELEEITLCAPGGGRHDPFKAPEELGRYYSGIGLSPDGRWVAARDDQGRLNVWSRKDKTYTRVLRKPIALAHQEEGRIEFTRDSTRMLVTNGRLADLYSMEPLIRIGQLMGHTQSVNAARFSGDGSAAVTVSDDGTARVWDLTPRPPILMLFGHDGPAMSADFAPDGQHVVTGSRDGSARTWNAKTGQTVEKTPIAQPVLAVRYSGDGKHIAVGREQSANALEVYARGDLSTPIAVMDTANVRDAQFNKNGDLLLVAAHDRAEIWDWQSRTRLSAFRHWTAGRWKTYRARFSPDGSQVATAAQDNTAHLFEVADGGKRVSWSRLLKRHNFYVYGLDFHPTKSEAVTTVWHYTAFITDLSGGGWS